MDTSLTNINALTNNNTDDYNPQIDNKNVVWSAYDGNDGEIFLYDHNQGAVIQLTDNDTYEDSPQISGDNIVWSAYDGNDNEIYLYNGTETIQLTDNEINDNNPKISGDNVVWSAYETNYYYRGGPPNNEIYLYNGTETIQLTENDTYESGFDISGDNVVWSASDGKDDEIYLYNGSETFKLTANSVYDNSPQISGDNIVWSAYDENDSEIYLYNGTDIIQLTDNDIYEDSPQVSGDKVVWSAYDGNDSEIYLYNGTETIQLTDNDIYEDSPQISGNNVVWSGYDGNDNEIYLYNGTDIIQLTDNDTYDSSPQISGDNVVWSGDDGNDSEIYVNYSLNLTPGEISGYKWHDLNENGLFDANEPGIEGWTIYLDRNQNGQLDGGETSTVTDSDGFYSFTDLRFGNYTVAEQNELRWTQTYPFNYDYSWSDSKQPDGITFDWVDISNVGTELNLGDDESSEVTLPFSFDFYGETYDTVNISADGYLAFGATDAQNSNTYSNSSIPNSYSLNNFIAPFWDDLNPAYSGSIYHYYDAAEDRFIVQYQDVARYEVEGSLTFQTILNADGSIVYQYQNMDAAVNSATVGLENSDGTAGLQIVYNNQNNENPYIENELAIGFTPIRSSNTVNSQEVFVNSGATVTDINFGNIDLITPEDIRIEAEDFQDNYDQYYDSDYQNQGGGYRDNSVDIEPTSDIGGGFNVGWIEAGEWLTYKVDIPYDGNYQLVARVASDLDIAHRLDLSLDGQTTVFNFGGTGGWQTWEDVTGDNLYLTAGSYELRLDMGSSGFNINYIDLIADRNSVNALAASDELLVDDANDNF